MIMGADHREQKELRLGWALCYQNRDLEAVEGDGDRVSSTINKLKKDSKHKILETWTKLLVEEGINLPFLI